MESEENNLENSEGRRQTRHSTKTIEKQPDAEKDKDKWRKQPKDAFNRRNNRISPLDMLVDTQSNKIKVEREEHSDEQADTIKQERASPLPFEIPDEENRLTSTPVVEAPVTDESTVSTNPPGETTLASTVSPEATNNVTNDSTIYIKSEHDIVDENENDLRIERVESLGLLPPQGETISDVNRENEKLKQLLQQKEDEIKKLSNNWLANPLAAPGSSSSVNNNLSAENRKLSDNIEKCTKENAKLKKKNLKQQKEIQALKKSVSAKNENIDSLISVNSNLTSELVTKEKEIQKLRDEVELNKKNLEQSEKSLKERNEENRKLRANLTLQLQAAKNEELDLNLRLDTAKEEVKELQAKIEILKKGNHDVSSQLAVKNSTIVKLQNLLNLETSKCSDQKRKLEQLEKNLKETKKTITECNKKNGKQRSEISKLTLQLTAAKKGKSALEIKEKTAQGKITELQTKVNTLEKEKRQIFNEQKNNNATHEKFRQEKAAESLNHKNEVDRIQKTVDTLKNQLEQFKKNEENTLKAQNAKILALKKKMSCKKVRLEQMKRLIEEELHDDELTVNVEENSTEKQPKTRSQIAHSSTSFHSAEPIPCSSTSHPVSPSTQGGPFGKKRSQLDTNNVEKRNQQNEGLPSTIVPMAVLQLSHDVSGEDSNIGASSVRGSTEGCQLAKKSTSSTTFTPSSNSYRDVVVSSVTTISPTFTGTSVNDGNDNPSNTPMPHGRKRSSLDSSDIVEKRKKLNGVADVREIGLEDNQAVVEPSSSTVIKFAEPKESCDYCENHPYICPSIVCHRIEFKLGVVSAKAKFRFATFMCQSINVGSYKVSSTNMGFDPAVHLTELGLQFKLPQANSKRQVVTMCIPKESILRTKINFTERVQMIYITTIPKYALWARQTLRLDGNPTNEKSYYYCPVQGKLCQRTIAFFGDKQKNSDISLIKELYHDTIQEI